MYKNDNVNNDKIIKLVGEGKHFNIMERRDQNKNLTGQK